MLRALVLLLGLVVCPLFAQNAPPPPKQPATTYQLSPEKRQKAIEYSRIKYRLTFFDFAYSLVQIGIVLALGIAPRVRSWAERVTSRRFVQAFLFVPLLMLVFTLFGLPLDVYREHLARFYGQSVQTWGSWAWDQTKALLLSLFFTTLTIWGLYALIRRSPRRWWLVSWLLALPFLVLLIWAVPVLIEPLFFKFTPLADKQPQLVTALQQVVQRGGLSIPDSRMFDMNASEKMNSLNAYVSGLGSSKRVVVFDTTISKMTIPEIQFVFGHEMGHYVLNHIYKGLAFAAAGLLASLLIAYYALNWLVARYGPRWGIRAVGDWASLPLLMLVFTLFGFFSEPIGNTFSRHQEHQADIYGLEVTHGLFPDGPQVAAQAFQILGETNLSDPSPSPFIKFWLYSHDPIADRIAFAQQYDPWDGGQRPKYVQ